jgi:hypothetical protein
MSKIDRKIEIFRDEDKVRDIRLPSRRKRKVSLDETLDTCMRVAETLTIRRATYSSPILSP